MINIGVHMDKIAKSLNKQAKTHGQMEQVLKKALAGGVLNGDLAKTMEKMMKAQGAMLNSTMKEAADGEKATKAAEGAMKSSGQVTVDVKQLKDMQRQMSAMTETIRQMDRALKQQHKSITNVIKNVK